MKDFLGMRALPLLQFVDRLDYFRQIHLVNLDPFADRSQQGDRELAAQVFAKFLEPLDDEQIVLGVHIKQFIGEKIESEFLNQL